MVPRLVNSDGFRDQKVYGSVYMRPGRCQTGMKFEIVSMFTRDRYDNHKSFDLFPLPAIVVFFYIALSSMCCSEAENAAETGMKCICVYIHPALDSSRPEDSQVGPAGGMTSDRSEHFPSRSHVNTYYK